VSDQHFVASLPELVARSLRELHAAHELPPFFRKQYNSQCGGWWMVSPPRCVSVRERYLRRGIHCGARHGCTVVNNRNTPYAPAKWTLCRLGTLAWGSTGLAAAFAYHRARLQSAPWRRKGVPSANACMQVLPIVRYGHMSMTADLPARDIAVLLPSVTQESSARDG
jgi:hypothetical protein